MSDQKTVRLIRERDLIDPMTGRKEWNVLSSSDDPDSAISNTAPRRSCQADHLYEVHSTSTPSRWTEGRITTNGRGPMNEERGTRTRQKRQPRKNAERFIVHRSSFIVRPRRASR